MLILQYDKIRRFASIFFNIMFFSNNVRNGAFLALLSGALYGWVGFFGIKLLNSSFTINSMLFWRFLISTIFIAILLLKRFRISKNVKKLLPEFLIIFFSGLVFYGTSTALYFISCDYLGTGLAMVICYAYPVFVMLMSWFIDRTKLNLTVSISLFLVVIGCIMIAGNNDFNFKMEGIVYGLIGCLAYAIYVYISKRRIQKLSTNFSTFVISLSNLVLFGGLSYLDGDFTVPSNLSDVYYVGIIGIISTALPILLLLESLNFISATRASILSVSEPIVTLLVGIAMLNENINMIQAVGVFFIIAGAITIQLDRKGLV
jgi:drug/metabolite transporter (DMT)-like permease